MSTAQPTSELPKQYQHAGPEARWYKFWLDEGLFHSEPDPARRPYTIVIPPPNVTGALHLGHALNNTLQDILIRMRRMQGYNALWMPGTDHAGIATQAVVERRLLQEEKKSRHDLGREQLVERIWSWKREYEQRILGQLQRLGASCDWQRTRFTLDDICARAVRHTFFKLFREGLIFRGKRLVNWDTFLQTAVSDDEVNNETVAGHFWHIRYEVIGPRPGEPTHVTIATTRPETLLGDTAVAVHPDPGAALDAVDQALREKLSAAGDKDRADIEAQRAALAERRATMLGHLNRLRDMAHDGRMLRLPLLGRELPLVADPWAKPELGSGCVKITPAHDPNDYDVWQRNPGIGAINILNPDGTLNDAAGPYRGLKIAEARRRVVADLETAGLLEKVEDRQIELPMSDRSKTPIEPYLADQWFVRMRDREDGRPGLAQMAMDAVSDGRVKIVPARYARGYLDWLGEKRDWPVSRQLWWGHQIPIWYCAGTSEAELRRAFAGRSDVTWRQAEDGATWLLCAEETDLAPDAVPGRTLVRDPDVLDTWFSSALWPHSTLGWPEATAELRYYYPTSTLITSRDIITLWVARMVLTGLFNVGDVPFREVFIHPKILDGYGETMSKSKGNGVDPVDVMDKFGADALRFGLAYLTTETQDIRLSVEFECPHCGALIEQTKKNRELPRIDCKKCGQPFRTQWASKPDDVALRRGPVVSERFELARNFCNKLWNAARFALLNLDGYTARPVTAAELQVEDRWILSRLATVREAVTAALDEYRFADAARQLYEFAWDEFCSFYVEIVKGRLQDPAARPAAQRVLAHTLDVLVRLLHPLMPFVTEEIWQLLAEAAPDRGWRAPARAARSVVIAPWPESEPTLQDAAIEQRFARFQDALKTVREIRSRQNIPPKTPLVFRLRTDAATADLLRPMLGSFETLAGARCEALGPDAAPYATGAQAHWSAGELFVDLSELIDVEAELARAGKERTNLQNLIRSKEVKLSNDGFVARAPAEVVAKEREALDEARRKLSAVEAAMAELERSRK